MTLLANIGYDSEKMLNAGFVLGVCEGILTICTVIPAITYTLIFILYQFAYPLTKKRLEPVYEYVRKVNASAKNALK